MLEKVLWHIHNWFEKDIVLGTFSITGGAIDVPGLKDGQWYRIVGSTFNDGLHRDDELEDEEFTGEVWLLAVPKVVEELADDIEDWCDRNGKAIDGPYQSESFGGYSYTLGSSPSGGSYDWQDRFRSRLSPWRKIG